MPTHCMWTYESVAHNTPPPPATVWPRSCTKKLKLPHNLHIIYLINPPTTHHAERASFFVEMFCVENIHTYTQTM